LTEEDCTGEGGGCSSLTGEKGDSTGDESAGGCLRGGKSLRLALLERPLRPDFTEAASAALSVESPFEGRTVEFLGLSVFPLPGILERRERKDREDSLVSDLLKDGYDCRGASLEPLPPFCEPLSFELWLPIVVPDAG
jgi:hypothetical protein